MYYSRPLGGALGFSLNPFHYVKKAAVAAGHGVAKGAHAVGHETSVVAHAVGHGAVAAADAVGHGIKVGIIKPFEWLASKATAPIRNRVHQLRDRRAAKLAWDRHHTTTPDAKDKADAKAWTKAHLKSQGPHGEVLQLFAGSSMPMLLGNTQLGDPVTLSLIAASIPVFMELMNKVLHKADASGQAPADPTRGAGGPPAPTAPGAPGPGAPSAPGADAGGGTDAGAGDDGSGGSGGHGKHGGGGAKLLGMPKKYVIIGGAVFGGVILLSLLTSSKKGSS